MRKSIAGLAGISVVVCLLAAPGCAPLDDETWLRIVSFTQGASSKTPVSRVTSDLGTTTDETIDINLRNEAVNVKGSGAGTGITVDTVEVSYQYGSFTPQIPSFSWGAHLYLSPRNVEDAASSASEGTLSGIPIVPVDLKQWFLDPGTFPAGISSGRFNVRADITVKGRTDEGKRLSVTGSLTIAFNG